MKKQLLAVIGVACTLAACSEALEEAQEVNEEGVYAILEQPTSIDTRSFTYENNKLVFTWGEGENLMAIGNGDVAMFRTLNADQASSKLDSKGFQLMDDVTYYAYIPAKSLPTSETVIPVSLLGQRQTSNDNSAHLKDFDYACAKATKDDASNSLKFNLENQIGWIIVEYTFTEALNNVTSVAISATDDIFVTEGTLDVATSTLISEATASQITLDLGKKGGEGISFTAGELFRGFFTVAPVDISGKTLTITATTKDGSTHELGTFTKETANILKGKFGLIQTSGSIPVTSQDELNDAITTGTTQGQSATVTLPSNSTFTLDNGIANEGTKSRDITFVGDGTQTIDVITKAVSAEGGMLNYQRGSSFTFKNMTIQAGEGSFDGIVCDELTYVKCTIKGKLTLYGKATFVDCTFENDMADQYSIWTWGGTDVKFEGCTFNTNGKAILLYGRATAEKPTNLTVTNCTFNDRTNGSHSKAAIEIGNDYNATYNLTVSGCTVNGFAVGKNTGSTLWANKNSMDAAHLSVTIDGTKVQ